MKAKLQKVLILCSGNSARSQMAEGFLRQMAGEQFEAMSAGMTPAPEINPLAVQVMQEAGIDLSGQKPKDLSLYLGKTFLHYLIIVCSKANDTCPRIWPGLIIQENRLYWPVDDPAEATGTEEEQLDAFRKARDEIREKLESWLASLG
ncbi:MAG: low molecular weight phosphatase family protein [Prosthecochloris sp.]|nr:low molecular weight phosphatase family protein [Prosthecochloris sp.]